MKIYRIIFKCIDIEEMDDTITVTTFFNKDNATNYIKDRIQELKEEEQGQEVIDKRGKFNSIFGLSRKKYEKLVQKAKENRVGEIGEIIKGVTIKESKEAGKVLGDITRGKKQEEQE